MATFPTNVRYGWREMRESRDSVVERTAMERGMPKQRRISSDVRHELELQLHFDTKAQAIAFETWFDNTIHSGQDFFDFVLPLTGATVQARFVGGELGTLSFLNPPLEKSTRPAKLEYWRPSWV